MIDKDELIEALRSNETYVSALNNARSKAERDAISSFVENFVVTITSTIASALRQSEATDEHQRLLTDVGHVSGSTSVTNG